ncbi:MAG TPA: peptidase S1, partial [Solibacterales bacterium]|nr:peptidase S1 [Bryobacterales bacterium]
MADESLGRVAERLRRSTVQLVDAGGRGIGSGVLWDAAGTIVTNAHVVRGSEARAELWDGRRARAQVLARDPRRDLARLRLDAPGLEPAEAGDSSRLRPGEVVIAIGNPLGFTGALTAGTVYGVGRL